MIKINNKNVGFIYKNSQNIDKVLNNGNIIFEQGFTREDSGSTPLTTSHQAIGKNLKNYKIYGNSRQNNLPDGYTEVEYLQGNNSGYIPTDIYLEGSDTIKFKFKTLETGATTCCVYGSYVSGRDDNYSLYIAGSQYAAYWRYADKLYQKQKFENDTLFEIEVSWDEIKVNETTYTTTFTESTFTTYNPIYIGHINLSSSPKIRGKLYYFEIVGKAKFIPCIRNSDNQVGMFNVNNNTFYPATGTMTAGNTVTPSSSNPIPIESVGDNILPSEYQEVEYIVGNNSGYITTDFYLTGSDTVKFKIDTTDWDNSCSVFGSYAGTSAGPNYSIYFSKTANAYVRYGSSTSREFRAYPDNLYNIEMTPTGFSVNGETQDTWEEQDFTTSRVMIIGSMSGSTSTSFKGKIYSCEVVGRAKYIPCYKKSDNTVGMYDVINETFYPATGTLTVGNDVNTYEIPITVSDGTNTTTTNIYLTQPLRKVGNYADYIDYETQKVYRNVVVNDDSGEDTIANSYSGTTDTTGTSVTLPSISSINGTTIYDVNTKVKPSNMYVKYKGK